MSLVALGRPYFPVGVRPAQIRKLARKVGHGARIDRPACQMRRLCVWNAAAGATRGQPARGVEVPRGQLARGS